ncbi:hypothetical protein M405DRAFT_911791 [Rhizopogon salebrosus TDB-379]|nr:hypothetical protein M405DRAFT_911791 [Rhizopogon salebrosus TDB-379]
MTELVYALTTNSSINAIVTESRSLADIILDPREAPIVQSVIEQRQTYLHYPPILVIIELDFCELPQLPGLPPRHVPLSPISSKFTVGSNPSIRVTRRQLALTPAYAFTDFKSQGQTIDHVLVDIGKTTCFGLSPFNAYVGLSRSRGRETIRLLRDFDDNLFIRHPFVIHPKTCALKTSALMNS